MGYWLNPLTYGRIEVIHTIYIVIKDPQVEKKVVLQGRILSFIMNLEQSLHQLMMQNILQNRENRVKTIPKFEQILLFVNIETA